MWSILRIISVEWSTIEEKTTWSLLIGKNGDRRYTRVALTEQGQRLRSRVIISHNYLINRFLERLPDEHLRELYILLQELSDELESQLENGTVAGLVADAVQ